MGPLISLNTAGIAAALKSTSRLFSGFLVPVMSVEGEGRRKAANNGHSDIRHIDRMQFTQSAYDALRWISEVCLILTLHCANKDRMVLVYNAVCLSLIHI